MVYRGGPGAGSPALHANLFRLVLLERYGGWWSDTDTALLRTELPSAPIYLAAEEEHFTNSILKFPSGHPLLHEAAELARKAGDDVPWATTGPTLLTALILKYGLEGWVAPPEHGCPFMYTDVPAFFDPSRTEELLRRSSSATFMHLCHEIWRRSGIPTDLGPPAGSFLDHQFRQSGLGITFPARIELRHLKIWLANAQAKSDLLSARSEFISTRAALEKSIAASHAELNSLKADSIELKSTKASLEKELDSARAEFAAYRLTVASSRWSRLGRWLGQGPTAARHERE